MKFEIPKWYIKLILWRIKPKSITYSDKVSGWRITSIYIYKTFRNTKYIISRKCISKEKLPGYINRKLRRNARNSLNI